MFHIKNQIPRDRLKGYPSLSIMVTMVLMGSVLFGSSSEDVEVASVRIPRDSSALSNCEKSLAESDFANCSNFCQTLQERLTQSDQKVFPWRLINTILIYLYIVTVPASIIVCIVHICRLKPKPTVITVPAQPLPVVVVDDGQVHKSGSFVPTESSCVSLTGDIPGLEDFSLEDIAIPAAAPGTAAPVARGGAAGRGGLGRGAFRGMRPETPEEKAAREHAIKKRKEQKSLARSSRFKQRGPIFLPREPEIPPPGAPPKNIILGDNVQFNEEYNEMFIVGSDVDDIELEPSTVIDSSASDSVTEKKKKKKKKDNSKTTETEDKSNKTKTKSAKKEQPQKKKKSGEAPVPQKKPSKESVPEKKPSKEGIPVKKPSKETLPEKKASKENLSEKKNPEKKVSKESVDKKPDEKKQDEKKEEEKKPDEEGAGEAEKF